MGKILTGQVAVTGAAQQIDPNNQGSVCVGFTIYAPQGNAQPVYLGSSGVTTATGHALDPGQSITYERRSQAGEPRYQLRPNDFWAVGTSGDRVTWLASP